MLLFPSRLVVPGQRVASAPRSLGVVEQTLSRWVQLVELFNHCRMLQLSSTPPGLIADRLTDGPHGGQSLTARLRLLDTMKCRRLLQALYRQSPHGCGCVFRLASLD